jgi:hypothetical protein
MSFPSRLIGEHVIRAPAHSRLKRGDAVSQVLWCQMRVSHRHANISMACQGGNLWQ